MHSEIAIVRRRFIGLYEQQREYLRGQNDVALRELARESEALLNSPELTVRVAAEINRAAAVLLLEER